MSPISVLCPQVSFSALLILFFSTSVSAQHGEIRYRHSSPRLVLPTDRIDELLGEPYVDTPTHVIITRTLNFDVFHSLMRPSDEESYVPGENEPMDIGWEFADSTYVRYNNSHFVESRKFYDDTFVVEDVLPFWSWKIVGPERIYLDYRVVKATSTTGLGKTIEAWFAPELPVPAGPGLYYGLPGLILMVTNNETGEIYSAEEIDVTVQPKSIASPVKGKRVSLSEYTQFVDMVVAEQKRNWDKVRNALRNVESVRNMED